MRTPHHTFRPRARDAFTLIELVAVIGIILMMTLVVVGSYVGITRAIAARAGINHVRNTVMVTRQHACMDGQRTYLYILNETDYVICRRAGRVSEKGSYDIGGNAYRVRDAYADLESYVNSFNEETGGLTVYDFDLSHAYPYATVTRLAYKVGNDPELSDRGWYMGLKKTSKFSVDPAAVADAFAVGHTYGIELYPKRSLPRGYTFVNGTPFKPFVNYFEPSGEPGGVGPNAADAAFIPIRIVELVNPTLVQSVTVVNGKIVVDTAGTED